MAQSTRSRPASLVPLAMVAVTALATQSGAAEQVQVFRPGADRVIGARAETWHRELEQDGDYGETWYFVVQTDNGGLLLASLAITNMGLRTFDAVVDARFFEADGQRHMLHREYRRRHIRARGDRLDVTIGATRLWREADTYNLHIDEDGMQARVVLQRQVSPYQFGDGKLRFAGETSAYWAIGFSAPRARASGTLTVGGRSIPLQGAAYHDHSWGSVKLPDFLTRWLALRVLHPQVTLVLHEQELSPAYGGGQIRFAMLGKGEQLIGGCQDFALEPRAWRRDEASGYRLPTAWHLQARVKGYTLEGTLSEERFLESVDILAVLSWPVRTLIKTFYARPYSISYMARYDLRLSDDAGVSNRIRGTAPVEIVYYTEPGVN